MDVQVGETYKTFEITQNSKRIVVVNGTKLSRKDSKLGYCNQFTKRSKEMIFIPVVLSTKNSGNLAYLNC